ncbi:MAG: transglutaminase, partial [Pirellulaceae bacterium]|nr:transglutaminase [Pirellulaceae bacterium]
MRIRPFLFLFLSLAFLWIPSRATAAPGDVVAKFPTPSRRPTGLAYDGKSLWTADRTSGLLYEINPADGKVIRTLTAPSPYIEGLAFAEGCLWAMDPQVKRIFKLNPTTGITENDFPVKLSDPQGLAFDGEFLWVADAHKGILDQLSTEDGTRINRLRAPNAGSYGLTFDGTYLWVADRLDDKLYMVAPETGDVIVTLNSPGKFPRGLAFDGTYLWNVDYQSNTLYKLVRDDGTKFVRTNGRRQRLELTQRMRNFGPGLITSADIHMAIPRNLPCQQLLAPPRFTPNPTDVLTDQWGQEAAHYRFRDVASDEEVETKMTVDAELFTVRYFLFPEKTGTLADVPKEIKDLYLQDGSKFWVDDPFMRKTSRQVVGDEKNCYWIARKILDHVTSKMHYNLDGVWDVAPTVLKQGSGSCSEYSFVFIALCRASGLPARYVGSVVVRDDDASTDAVFHRWPEVYLPHYGWVPIDPSSGRGIFKTPVDKANVIGYRGNKYLITTIGGGNSSSLRWD